MPSLQPFVILTVPPDSSTQLRTRGGTSEQTGGEGGEGG